MHARLLRMRPGATHGRENVFLVRGGSPLRLALASESLELSSVLVPLAGPSRHAKNRLTLPYRSRCELSASLRLTSLRLTSLRQ